MIKSYIIVILIIFTVSFLNFFGCETHHKPNEPSSTNETEIMLNIEKNVTIEANGIRTYSFMPINNNDYTIYIRNVDDNFTYKCDFDHDGIKGEKSGENFCVIKELSGGGNKYNFTLESYSPNSIDLTILIVQDDLTISTVKYPQKLELNVSKPVQIGAYKNQAYFTFKTNDSSKDIIIYLHKNPVALNINIHSASNFSGSIYQLSIPKEITDTIVPILDLNKNTTYYMTIENSASTFADLILKVNHYITQEITITDPSILKVGTLNNNLNLVERSKIYSFSATNTYHDITLTSDSLLWTLYKQEKATYKIYFRCWSSSARKTKCRVSNLFPGTSYYLQVGCFFAPTCTKGHTILIQ